MPFFNFQHFLVHFKLVYVAVSDSHQPTRMRLEFISYSRETTESKWSDCFVLTVCKFSGLISYVFIKRFPHYEAIWLLFLSLFLDRVWMVLLTASNGCPAYNVSCLFFSNHILTTRTRFVMKRK